MSEKIDNIGCIVFWLLLISGTVFMCVRDGREKDAEKRRNELYADSVAQRRQFVADSIDSVMHSPEYIARMDSLRLAEQKEREAKDKQIVVMVCLDDGLYHYMTKCLYMPDINKIRFMSRYDAENMGYEECLECHYDDEEYIYFENVIDYVKDHYDKFEIIDYFDIETSDFEEY